jgi:hypothetical protein
MIIAKDISDDLILAVQRVPGVALARYHLTVSVEPVSTMNLATKSQTRARTD